MRNNCLLYSFDYNTKFIYDEKPEKLFFSVQPDFYFIFLSWCVRVCECVLRLLSLLNSLLDYPILKNFPPLNFSSSLHLRVQQQLRSNPTLRWKLLRAVGPAHISHIQSSVSPWRLESLWYAASWADRSLHVGMKNNYRQKQTIGFLKLLTSS